MHPQANKLCSWTWISNNIKIFNRFEKYNGKWVNFRSKWKDAAQRHVCKFALNLPFWNAHWCMTKLIFSWLAGIYRDDCAKTEESKGWLGGHIRFATKEVVFNFGHWNVPWNVNRVYSTFEVDSSWVARDRENSYHHCAHRNQANVSRGRGYDLSLKHLQKCIWC